jgi:hypothetical protein
MRGHNNPTRRCRSQEHCFFSESQMRKFSEERQQMSLTNVINARPNYSDDETWAEGVTKVMEPPPRTFVKAAT